MQEKQFYSSANYGFILNHCTTCSYSPLQTSKANSCMFVVNRRHLDLSDESLASI